MSGPDLTRPTSPRAIRVFVSSTFLDMQAERDELAKNTFIALRRLCEQRQVIWGEVDLRWGITSEEAAEGKILPICLAEVDRCRPYFIGLLGERYGDAPQNVPEELLEREPWLTQYRDRSVTELEILHGVLNHPHSGARAFFYFRDSKYIEKKAPAQQTKLQETPQEVSSSGRRLADLKDRIRQNKLPIRNYLNRRELGELVLADLTKLVDELFPPQEVPDQLDRERAAHQALAASHSNVYLRRDEIFVRLDEQAEGDGPPLVVLADTGVGKSALLANWAQSYEERHPDALLFNHFAGATPYDIDWAGMVRRLLGELNRRFNLQVEIPETPEKLRSAFAEALQRAAFRRRFVLVIDGLNQFGNQEQEEVWLPQTIPTSVRLILSTVPGGSWERFKQRGWTTLHVAPLDVKERRHLVQKYLWEKHRKRLESRQVEQVVVASQTASPLFLRTLLEELRLFGLRENLEERIAYYLEARTVPQLFQRVLARFEEDYEKERRPGLVRDAMSLLWAARRGLTEREILDLLGANGIPLPRATWSPLQLAAWESLVNRLGLLAFFHEDLRRAVEQRYLSSGREKKAAHLRLAGYFEQTELTPRKVDELPWQLHQAEDWERLYELLTDPPFFAAACSQSHLDILRYWSEIQQHTSHSALEGCQALLASPTFQVAFVFDVASLLGSLGHPAEAAAILNDMARSTTWRIEGDKYVTDLGMVVRYSRMITSQAQELITLGRLDEAFELASAAEGTFRTLEVAEGLAVALTCRARVLRRRGQLDVALQALKEAEEIFRRLGDDSKLCGNLLDQGNVFSAQGENGAAHFANQEAEALARVLGDPVAIAAAVGNQAILFVESGDTERALPLLRQQESICRDFGQKESLQRSLGYQGIVLERHGFPEEALLLLEEQARLCHEIGKSDIERESLTEQARILEARGRTSEAIARLGEAETLARASADRSALRLVLQRKARCLADAQELEEALRILDEEEQLCRSTGSIGALAKCLGRRGYLLVQLGRLPEALKTMEEAQPLLRNQGLRELEQELEPTISWLRERLANSIGVTNPIQKEQRMDRFKTLAAIAIGAAVIGILGLLAAIVGLIWSRKLFWVGAVAFILGQASSRILLRKVRKENEIDRFVLEVWKSWSSEVPGRTEDYYTQRYQAMRASFVGILAREGGDFAKAKSSFLDLIRRPI